MANELRRRRLKIKESNGSPMSKKYHKNPKGFSIQTSLLCLIISGTILTLFCILYVDNIPWQIGSLAIDHIVKNFGYHKPVYAVVIDAGSTGSRVLAFTFHESYIGQNLVLDRELFKYNKKSLSSFADAPEKCADSLSGLIEEAKKEIPSEYWHNTSLLLKATAGLRLLQKDKADKILENVKSYFKTSPFLTKNNSVEIMDGSHEGIFSWFTVNFLLGKINGDPANTVAALDLGGASCQVTFAALTPASLKQKAYIQPAPFAKGKVPVYTNSFLGLGLMAVRKAVVTFRQNNKKNVTSDCVNHIVVGKKLKFGNEIYYVSGPQENYPLLKIQANEYRIAEDVPIVNVEKCASLVKNHVAKYAVPPAELPNKALFAFSYFFDKAADAELIDPMTGGKILVEDFKKAAVESCHTPNVDQPFMCLDLIFIWTFLENGLGLRLNTPIHLYKKINGHVISWALGAAYDALKENS